jgi:hypothetical protein
MREEGEGGEGRENSSDSYWEKLQEIRFVCILNSPSWYGDPFPPWSEYEIPCLKRWNI